MPTEMPTSGRGQCDGSFGRIQCAWVDFDLQTAANAQSGVFWNAATSMANIEVRNDMGS